MRVKWSIVTFAFLVCGLHAATFSQSINNSEDNQSVTGRVTMHGKGVGGVKVLMWPWPATEPQRESTVTAQTDQDGNYRIANLKPGNYYVAARSEVYVAIANGEAAQPRYISIVPGQSPSNIDFEIVRGAAVTGRVTNSEGQPIIEEPVTLARVQLSPESSPTGSAFNNFSARTDDRGVYRIFAIPPGRYRVVVGWPCAAMASIKGRPGYERVFYPGVAEESRAKVIELTDGAEISDIDLKLNPPAKMFSVSGKIVDSDTGRPVPNLNFGLDILSEGKPRCGVSDAGSTNDKGEFKIENIPPGRYSIRIPPGLVPISTAPPVFFSDRSPFDLTDRDVTDIVVRVMRTSSVSGVVVLEPTTNKIAQQKFSQNILTVASIKTGSPVSIQRSQLATDGSFSISGLRPGALYWSIPPPFKLIRVERGTIEQNQNIEMKAGELIDDVRLTVVWAAARVTGTVKFENGTLKPDMRVVARLWSIPPTESRMPVSATFVDANGHFLLENVPAGTYRLVVSAESANQAKTPISAREIIVSENTDSEITITLDLTP